MPRMTLDKMLLTINTPKAILESEDRKNREPMKSIDSAVAVKQSTLSHSCKPRQDQQFEEKTRGTSHRQTGSTKLVDTNQMKLNHKLHTVAAHAMNRPFPAGNGLCHMLTVASLLIEILSLVSVSKTGTGGGGVSAAFLTSSRNFPFKTSFVSSSDNTQLRRNGALASLQLANLEQANQQYPSSDSLLLNAEPSFESSGASSHEFEPQTSANAAGEQHSNHRDSTPLTQLIGGDSSDDLLAVPSTNNNNQSMANEAAPTTNTGGENNNNTSTATIPIVTTSPPLTTTTTTTASMPTTTNASSLTTSATTTTGPEATTTTSTVKPTTETAVTRSPISTSKPAIEPEVAGANFTTTNTPSSTVQTSTASTTSATTSVIATTTTTTTSTTTQPTTTVVEVANNSTLIPDEPRATTTTTAGTPSRSDPTTTAATAAAATTTTTTTTTLATTTIASTTKTPRRDREEFRGGPERESRTSERDPGTMFGGRLAPSASLSAWPDRQQQQATATSRGQVSCSNGNSDGKFCGSFVVSKMPVFERWPPTANRNSTTANNTGSEPTRVVNEFVFVPEDSGPLELDQSDFVNVTTTSKTAGQQNADGSIPLNDTQLAAEHRAIDGPDLSEPTSVSSFANSSLMLVNDNGEVDLDYMNLDSNDSNDRLVNQMQPAASDGPTFNSAPADKLKPTTTTSTTTSTTQKPALSSTVATTAATTITTTSTTTTKRPDRTVAAQQRQQLSSITISELQSERLGLMQRQTTSTSTTTTTTSRPAAAASHESRREQLNAAMESIRTKSSSKPAASSAAGLLLAYESGRKNNKFLAEPENRISETSTRSSRPKLVKLDNLRTASARRLSSSAGQQQHKQVFNEPTGDWNRRRQRGGGAAAETFSPLNNGADEEEASILTRYSMSSQLSRLSSLGRPVSAPPGAVSSSHHAPRRQSPARGEGALPAPGRRSPLAMMSERRETMGRTTSPTTPAPERSVATSTSTSVQWSVSSSSSTSSPIRALNNGGQVAETGELLDSTVERGSRAEMASSSSRIVLDGSDLISKIMEEEDQEAGGLRTTGEQPLVMTLIASSSPASKTEKRQSPMTTTTTTTTTTPAAESSIETKQARSTSTSTTINNGTTNAVQIVTLSPQKQVTTTTTTTGAAATTTTAMSASTTSQTPDVVSSTRAEDEQSVRNHSSGEFERLVDQVIKEQLERDDASDNKRPRSSSSSVSTSSIRTAATAIVNSYHQHRRQSSPSSRPKAKPSTVVGQGGNQVIVIKTSSNNPHDYDSGKWQPDTNLDYALIHDYDYNKQQHGQQQQQTTNGNGNANGLGAADLANTASSLGTTTANNNNKESLPGRPGVDYPVHWQVPKTSFDCRNYEQSGFYADVESDCQAYHSCHRGRGGRHTFLCPNGTLFSQELLTCDWWYNVECSQSKFYMPNSALNEMNDESTREGPIEKVSGDGNDQTTTAGGGDEPTTSGGTVAAVVE